MLLMRLLLRDGMAESSLKDEMCLCLRDLRLARLLRLDQTLLSCFLFPVVLDKGAMAFRHRTARPAWCFDPQHSSWTTEIDVGSYGYICR